MDRKALKTLAKQKIKGQIFMLFVIILLIEIALCVIGLVPMVGGIITLLISGAITLSITNIYYQLVVKNKAPQIEDILYGFRDDNFVRSLVAYLVVEIFTFLWSLLLVIPGIIKSFSYSQTFYIMADDPKIGGNEARKLSMKMMHGHKWEYFVLQLSFIPWHILAFFTFGLLYIYVAPYIAATNMAYYQKLSAGYVKSQESQKPAKAKITAKKTAAKKK